MSNKAHTNIGDADAAAKTCTINNSTSAETKGRKARIPSCIFVNAVDIALHLIRATLPALMAAVALWIFSPQVFHAILTKLEAHPGWQGLLVWLLWVRYSWTVLEEFSEYLADLVVWKVWKVCGGETHSDPEAVEVHDCE